MLKKSYTIYPALFALTCSCLFGADREQCAPAPEQSIPSLQKLVVKHFVKQILKSSTLIESETDLQNTIHCYALPDIAIRIANEDYTLLTDVVFRLTAQALVKKYLIQVAPGDEIEILAWLLPYRPSDNKFMEWYFQDPLSYKKYL